MNTEAATPTGQVLEAIGRCRELTDAMLTAAVQRDWQRVAELEGARRAAVDRVRVEHLDAADRAAVREPLAELVALDARLAETAGDARRRALTELRTARGQLRGSVKYQQLAGRA